MVAAYHLVWTAYGWWLPNDPRGSWSRAIRVEPIAELGEAHPGRKKIQPSSQEIRAFQDAAEDILAHPRLPFAEDEIELIGGSISETIKQQRYTCYACAIMPDHVHLVIRRHRDKAEEMIKCFQHNSREALIAAGIRQRSHPVWGGKGWNRFLNTRSDIEGVIRYILRNPVKEGRPEQEWEFVMEYDGWLPN